MNIVPFHKTGEKMSGIDEVRSLARGLEILLELNTAGSARAGILAKRVGLARPTVYRLLETLEESGFIAKSSSDDRYRTTARTAQFFQRYQGSRSVSAEARAVFTDAARASPWPMYFSVFDNGSMVVCLVSRPAVPLLPLRGFLGRVLSLEESSAGLAYSQARELGRHQQPEPTVYAENVQSTNGISELSVAVKTEGAVLGTLTIVCYDLIVRDQRAELELGNLLTHAANLMGSVP